MITDPNEYTPFSEFTDVGITAADTLNIWRKKENGIVQILNEVEANNFSQDVSLDLINATLTINADAVTESKIAENSVTNRQIADNSISGTKIANASITAAQLAYDPASAASSIADDIVTTPKIQNNAVTEPKIADNAVTTTKINAGAITNVKIADNAVSSAKIADSNVTTVKIADNAVISTKLSAGSVLTTKIGDGQVTTVKIASNGVTNSNIVDGSISGAKLTDTSITASKLDSVGTLTEPPIYGCRAWLFARLLQYTGTAVFRDETKYKTGTWTYEALDNTSLYGTFYINIINITSHNFKKYDKCTLLFYTGSANKSRTVEVLGVLDNNRFVVNAQPTFTNGSPTIFSGSGGVKIPYVNILKSGNFSTGVYRILPNTSTSGTTLYGAGIDVGELLFNFNVPMLDSNYAMSVNVDRDEGSDEITKYGNEARRDTPNLYDSTYDLRGSDYYQAYITTGGDPYFVNIAVYN